MSELASICETAFNECLKLGAEEVEVYASNVNEKQVIIERDEIRLGKTQYNSGIGIRVILKKSLGFACVNSLEKRSVKAISKRAVKLAKSSPADKFNVLPPKMRLPTIKALYDKEAENFSSEDCVEAAKLMLDTIKDCEGKILVESGEFSSLINENAIVNSYGIHASEKKSLFSWYVLGRMTSGEISFCDHEFGETTMVEGINVEKTALDFVKRVKKYVKAKKVKRFKGDVILTPNAASVLIADVIAHAVNSENVQKGTFPLFKGKIGAQVASQLITVEDNGILPGGVGSGVFDREGVPHQRTVLIERGKLKNYLYHTSSAARQNKRTTGNAVGGYRDLPKVSITNLKFENGDMTIDEMIESTNRGIIVNGFRGFPLISGDFSGAIKGSEYIVKGETQYCVKDAAISGNIRKSLMKIDAVSLDVKIMSQFILPYFRIKDMYVSSHSEDG